MNNNDNNTATLYDDVYVSFEDYLAATNHLTKQDEVADDSYKYQDATRHTFVIYKKWHISWSKETSATLDTDIDEFSAFKSKDPFEIIDSLKDNNEKLEEIVFFLEKVAKIEYSERFANRLKNLIEDSIEEYPDEDPINPESLRYCIKFLYSVENFEYPDIVVTPDKNIRLQWRRSRNKHFAVEFLPTGDAHFVIFAPNSMHPEKIKRLSGIISVEELFETVKSQGVLSWCLR